VQPSTDQIKFGIYGCTLLVPCFLIAKKLCEVRIGRYDWVTVGEVVGSREVIGLSNFISEFTNLLGTNN